MTIIKVQNCDSRTVSDTFNISWNSQTCSSFFLSTGHWSTWLHLYVYNNTSVFVFIQDYFCICILVNWLLVGLAPFVWPAFADIDSISPAPRIPHRFSGRRFFKNTFIIVVWLNYLGYCRKIQHFENNKRLRSPKGTKHLKSKWRSEAHSIKCSQWKLCQYS